jgi:hypothetical protein
VNDQLDINMNYNVPVKSNEEMISFFKDVSFEGIIGLFSLLMNLFRDISQRKKAYLHTSHELNRSFFLSSM